MRRRRTSCAQTLPEVAGAAAEGDISLDHVRYFTYALDHCGNQPTREVLPELLDVARVASPSILRDATRRLREAVYPDSLDEAWINGMEREDLQVNAVPEGFHVTGFLNSATGAKLKTVLRSLTAPAGANDPRPAAQRRVDGLETLLDSVLNNGLPGDQGVRPHVTLTVDADALGTGEGTGDLEGFGPIGLRQVKELICAGDITTVAVRTSGRGIGARKIGRTMRLAAGRQRTEIMTRQNRICAAPGCTGPVVHIHHVVFWADGGSTDDENLIGLCPRCHRAVHAGVLVIDPATHEFCNRVGHTLPGRDPTQRRRRRIVPRPAVRQARYRSSIRASS
ncbi:MAG TPA: DUF222 domain-containing protein [Aeromicrobium sp.]|nr:DUF222 domain-containing protein [Aeromicrobium sp.]